MCFLKVPEREEKLLKGKRFFSTPKIVETLCSIIFWIFQNFHTLLFDMLDLYMVGGRIWFKLPLSISLSVFFPLSLVFSPSGGWVKLCPLLCAARGTDLEHMPRPGSGSLNAGYDSGLCLCSLCLSSHQEHAALVTVASYFVLHSSLSWLFLGLYISSKF